MSTFFPWLECVLICFKNGSWYTYKIKFNDPSHWMGSGKEAITIVSWEVCSVFIPGDLWALSWDWEPCLMSRIRQCLHMMRPNRNVKEADFFHYHVYTINTPQKEYEMRKWNWWELPRGEAAQILEIFNCAKEAAFETIRRKQGTVIWPINPKCNLEEDIKAVVPSATAKSFSVFPEETSFYPIPIAVLLFFASNWCTYIKANACNSRPLIPKMAPMSTMASADVLSWQPFLSPPKHLFFTRKKNPNPDLSFLHLSRSISEELGGITFASAGSTCLKTAASIIRWYSARNFPAFCGFQSLRQPFCYSIHHLIATFQNLTRPGTVILSPPDKNMPRSETFQLIFFKKKHLDTVLSHYFTKKYTVLSPVYSHKSS